MEKLIKILLAAVVIYYGYPYVANIVAEKKNDYIVDEVAKLNDLSTNAGLMGLAGEGTTGYSKINAYNWYRKEHMVFVGLPDMTHIIYREGVWRMATPPQTSADLFTMITPHFSVTMDGFLKDGGYETVEDAKKSLGSLDAWAQEHDAACFVGYLYNQYGGVITPFDNSEEDLMLDALVNIPDDALPVIRAYPDLLTDQQMVTVSKLLNQGIRGEYGPLYPIGMAQACLNAIIVNASNRPSDVWKKIDLSALNESTLNLSGVRVSKVNIPITGLSKATSFEGADFSDVDLKGFNPSRKSLRNAKMPEDVNSPRLFRWTTGITPAPGTIWLDGSRPWG